MSWRYFSFLDLSTVIVVGYEARREADGEPQAAAPSADNRDYTACMPLRLNGEPVRFSGIDSRERMVRSRLPQLRQSIADRLPP